MRRRHGCGPEPQGGLDSLDGALNRERPCYSQRCRARVEQPSKQLNHDILDGSNGNGGAGISFLSLRPKGDGDHQGAHSDEAVQNPEDVPVLPVACCPCRCASAHGGRWHRRRPPQEWRMEARRFRLGAAEGRASRGKSHPSRVDLLRGRWWDAKPGGGRPCGRLSASTMWPDNVPSPSYAVPSPGQQRDLSHGQLCKGSVRCKLHDVDVDAGAAVAFSTSGVRPVVIGNLVVVPFVGLGAKSKGESLGQIQTRLVQQRQSLHRGVSIRPGSRRARQAWRPSMMGVAQQIVPQGILDATLDSWSPARPPHHNLVRHTASAATAPPDRVTDSPATNDMRCLLHSSPRRTVERARRFLSNDEVTSETIWR